MSGQMTKADEDRAASQELIAQVAESLRGGSAPNSCYRTDLIPVFPWFCKDLIQYNAFIRRCHSYSYYIYSGKTIKISLQSKKFTFVFKVIQNAYTRSYNIIS